MTRGRAWWPRPRRPFRSSPRPQALGRWLTAGAMGVAAVLLLVGQESFRPLEARVSAAIIAAVQLAPSHQIGTFVVMPVEDVVLGLDITTACTAALLISPFCLLAAGLIALGRVTVRRGVSMLAATALALFVGNQARFFVIALSLRLWGYPKGYELSHILFGTVVSTLGILGGLIVFVISAKRAPRPQTALVG